MPARRSYGTGSLYARADSNGRETWYGIWWSGSRRVKRRIGPKRADGTREGLTKPQAETELRRLIAETPATLKVTGDRLTISQAGRRYVRHLEDNGRKPSTLAAVRGHFEHWLDPFLGDRSLDAIRAEDVADLVALMRAGQRPGGLARTKPLSPKTIRNAIGTLSALYAHAQKKRWATANPAREIDLPSIPVSDEIRFLEPADVEAVAAAAIDGPYQAVDRALYLTAAMTGLRVGELCALRWRDVDWIAARVRVRQNYVLGEFGTPKSRRSTRSVPMADQVAGELDRLYKAVGEPDDDALVFADPVAGGPLAKKSILTRFRAALAAANLDDTHRVHDLRHTFGTRMAAAGVPMRTLQEWMGHRDIATTQRYADYAPSAQEAAYVAAAFSPRSTGPVQGLVTPA